MANPNTERIEDRPKEGESWIDYFRRKRRFSDLILLAWGLIESNIDQIVLKQFGLPLITPHIDKRARILLEMNFGKKIEFLKQAGVITKDEFNTIQEFQKYRNKLFHGKEWWYLNLREDRKEKFMNSVVKALDITHKANQRYKGKLM